MCQKSVMKNQQGVTDFIRNWTLFVVRAVFKVHEHVDLHNSAQANENSMERDQQHM